jgi:uncharacterized membrane protein
VLLLVAGGLVYPTLALKRTVGHPHAGWTLDGMASVRREHPDDYAGIRWLWENAEPGEVVLEAVGPEWGYHGRVSAATGLPTLLGWDGHEYQWRGGQPEALAEIGPRREVAQRIYETTDVNEARHLLQQYGVDYVFFGALESYVSLEAREKFAEIGTLAFDDPVSGVRIYRVGEGP